MMIEEEWRGSWYYLTKLNRLDAHLSKIDVKLLALQRGWIADVKETLKTEAFQQASVCFEMLLSDEMVTLEMMNWAEHTCYCPARTEERLAYEMDARGKLGNKRLFDSYHIQVAFTQTDYLLTHHVNRNQEKKLKRMMLKLEECREGKE